MLKVENLVVNYGAINALKGINIDVPEKSIVTLIGANGAGKTTTLRTISGIIRSSGGKILYGNQDITKLPPHKVVGLGICQVPEGRMIFSNLTVISPPYFSTFFLIISIPTPRPAFKVVLFVVDNP